MTVNPVDWLDPAILEKITPGAAADRICMIDSAEISALIKNKTMNFENFAATLQGLAPPVISSSIKYITSESDLPPLLGGFHQLELDKNYVFTEPFAFSDPILFPAGWIGRVSKPWLTSNFVTYIGATPMFQTLNIDGIINSISDAGSGAITVTLDAPHNMIDGQYVNITDTTSYNQNALIISNASGSVFDVQIPYVADEAGLFNTGFRSIQFDQFDAANTGTTEFMDLTSAGIVGTLFTIDRFAELGFLGPGTVRNGRNVIIGDAIFGFISSGLTLENCETTVITISPFSSLAAIPGVKALVITGALTDRVTLRDCKFEMGEATQLPMRIDGTVVNANEILVSDSPDNNVATDYFDTSSGGLDQKNPQVNAINNGKRANSMVISESSSVAVLQVSGTSGDAVPIVHISPLSGDYVSDPSTETFSLDDALGIVTYNGLKPSSKTIKFSLRAAQESGSAQEVDITLYIQGVAQTKTTIHITTAGTSTFVSGVYNGGNFLINPGDTFQLYKHNTSNTTDTKIQNAILLIN